MVKGAISTVVLKAVYAFLRTIPPIENHVPDPIIAAAAAAPGQ
jgi:hypothetical protein